MPNNSKLNIKIFEEPICLIESTTNAWLDETGDERVIQAKEVIFNSYRQTIIVIFWFVDL